MIIIDMQYFGDKGAASGKSGGGGANYKEVDDDSIFDNSVNRWENDITPDEENTVFMYTGSLYEDLNKGLRNDDASDFKDEIKSLDSALKKFNLDTDIVTYRGVDKAAFGGQIPKVGMVIKDKAYMSTSISKDIAEGFDSGYILRINVPKGKGRGAYVKYTSQYRDEKEFLMPRGTSLKINKIANGNTLGFHDGQQVIYADLV